MHALIHSSSDDFVARGAALLLDSIRDTIQNRGHCVLGLSGGSTPRLIYETVGRDKTIDWGRVWFFLIDERHTPSDNPDSNTRLVTDTILGDAPPAYIREHFLFPETSLPIDACVSGYDAMLRMLFEKQGFPDVITLGLGEDGHIASLFPPVLQEAKGPALAIHTTTPSTSPGQASRFAVRDRISVTFPVLTGSRRSLFFLKGETKKHTWEKMMASPEGPRRWPAKALSSDRVTVLLG